MTMNKKMTAIAIAALTLTANASDHHDEKKGPKAKPTKVDGKRKLPPALAKFDKNKDGKLSEVERRAARADFMKRFDKNKDGKIDEKERKAAMAERRKNAKNPKGKGKRPKGSKGKPQQKKTK